MFIVFFGLLLLLTMYHYIFMASVINEYEPIQAASCQPYLLRWSGSGGEHRSIKFHGNACVVVGACEGPKTPKISKESTHTDMYIYIYRYIRTLYLY